MGRNGELVLKSLAVRNFAIIEKLDLEFEKGLAVFTGETGAGKSILIEALGFLLGERGSTDWLRAGAAKLEVSGEFFDQGKTIRLRRELDAKGRSRAFLDGRPAKLSELTVLGEGLVDFHGQHEHQSLLDPGTQLDLLDDFGGLSAQREAVGKAYRDWKEAEARRDALELSEDERLRRIDLASFQHSEIGETDPQPGEEEKLAAELPRMKNAGKLGELAAKAYGALYGERGSTEESLGRAEESLVEMARLDPAMESAVSALQKARERISEVSGELADRRRGEVSPEKLDALIGRQDKIARLKRKYGGSVEAVLEFRDRAQRELDALENHELETKMAAKELAVAQQRFKKVSE
ncbi:MAG: AAA family ATPase, partial [Elusimicrobiota bacterium]